MSGRDRSRTYATRRTSTANNTVAMMPTVSTYIDLNFR